MDTFCSGILVEASYFRDSSKLPGSEVDEIKEVKRQESMTLTVHNENVHHQVQMYSNLSEQNSTKKGFSINLGTA